MTDALTAEKELSQAWMKPFLQAFADSGNVAKSCRKAKVSRQTVYLYRREDTIFKQAFDEARRLAVGTLEDVAWSRALHHSDTLLIFLLKAHDPDRYREIVNQNLGGKIQVEIVEADDSDLA